MLTRRRFLAALPAMPWAAQAAAATARFLTAADVHTADYPTVMAVRWIGEQLQAATGGRLGIRSYHSGQLGREPDTVDLVRFGGIDITRVHFSILNNAFPATRVACLPYAFDSVPHMRRAIDGAFGRAVLAGFAARGLLGLAIYDSGVRSIYNVARPIHEPGDLAGLKIRVPPSDLFIALGAALGANPTPLPYGEVYSGLSTHLIDGAENNLRTFHSTRQFEVARYWSETMHSFAPEALLMSRDRFDRFAARERETLLAAASASVPYMRSLWDQGEAAARTKVLAGGVRINTVNRPAFRRAAAPVSQRYLADPELARLQALVREVA